MVVNISLPNILFINFMNENPPISKYTNMITKPVFINSAHNANNI